MSKKVKILICVFLSLMMMPIVTLSAIASNESTEAPKILTTALPKAYNGQPYYIALEASGDGPITWDIGSSLSSKPLPPSLTYNADTGVILGILEAPINLPASLDVIVTAKNSAGWDRKSFVLEMLPDTGVEPEYPPGAPKIITAELPNFIVGQEYSCTISATGNEPITWAAATFIGNYPLITPYFSIDAKTGVLTRDPRRELTNGAILSEHKLIIFAVNSEGIAAKTFILEVRPPDDPSGAVVSGRIRSFNPGNPTTVMLMQEGKEVYKTAIEAVAGYGQVEQIFTFDNVAPGNYTLTVTKQTHLDYVLTDVIVEADDLDLAKSTDQNISMITLPCGDINGDGFINSTDLSLLILPANYNKQVTASGVDKRADLAGVGWVDSSSLGIIIQPANYDRTRVVYSYR